jgi:uncharacterized protein
MDSPLGLFVLNTVLVPGATLRLHVFEDRYKKLMADCIERALPFGVLLDRNGNEVGPNLDPVSVGTTAVIRQISKLASGRLYVIAVGLRRFKTDRMVTKEPYLCAEVSYLREQDGGRDTRILRDLALERFREYLEVLLAGAASELDSLDLPTDSIAASYIIADALQISPVRKQVLLEKASAAERLSAELTLLENETMQLRKLRARKETSAREPGGSGLATRFSRNY